MSAEIKGISKIVHTSHRKCPKMTVVFVADEAPGSHILGAPQCKTKWCTEEEIKAFSNFVLDQHDSKLVLEAYEHVLPLSLLESQAEGGEKRRRESGSMGLDRSTLRQERPLEDQLLEQAGYKKYGNECRLTVSTFEVLRGIGCYIGACKKKQVYIFFYYWGGVGGPLVLE